MQMCVCLLQVLQQWDDSKFNFTKALQKEVLFQFEASDMPAKGSSFVPLAPVTGDCQSAILHVHLGSCARSKAVHICPQHESWHACY